MDNYIKMVSFEDVVQNFVVRLRDVRQEKVQERVFKNITKNHMLVYAEELELAKKISEDFSLYFLNLPETEELWEIKLLDIPRELRLLQNILVQSSLVIVFRTEKLIDEFNAALSANINAYGSKETMASVSAGNRYSRMDSSSMELMDYLDEYVQSSSYINLEVIDVSLKNEMDTYSSRSNHLGAEIILEELGESHLLEKFKRGEAVDESFLYAWQICSKEFEKKSLYVHDIKLSQAKKVIAYIDGLGANGYLLSNIKKYYEDSIQKSISKKPNMYSVFNLQTETINMYDKMFLSAMFVDEKRIAKYLECREMNVWGYLRDLARKNNYQNLGQLSILGDPNTIGIYYKVLPVESIERYIHTMEDIGCLVEIALWLNYEKTEGKVLGKTGTEFNHYRKKIISVLDKGNIFEETNLNIFKKNIPQKLLGQLEQLINFYHFIKGTYEEYTLIKEYECKVPLVRDLYLLPTLGVFNAEIMLSCTRSDNFCIEKGADGFYMTIKTDELIEIDKREFNLRLYDFLEALPESIMAHEVSEHLNIFVRHEILSAKLKFKRDNLKVSMKKI